MISLSLVILILIHGKWKNVSFYYYFIIANVTIDDQSPNHN